MSIAYAHYLIPIPDDLDYIATPAEVVRLIRGMHDAGWLDSARDDYRLGEYEGAGHAKASVRIDELGEAIHRAVAAGRHIVIDLNLRAPAEPAAELFQEMPSGTPLGPEQCWGAQLVLCHRLCTPRQDSESSAKLLCPTCGKNLLVARESSGAPWEDVACEFEGRLDRCASCGSIAPPKAIKGQSQSAVDGSLRDEAAPVFRFALRLYSDAPPDDPAVTDPAVLEALRAATGKAFRAVGRWC